MQTSGGGCKNYDEGGAGAILNSKSQYNHCHISRLRVEEEEEVKARAKEQKKAWEQIDRELSSAPPVGANPDNEEGH